MKNILKYLLIIFASIQGLGQNYVQLDAFDVNRFPIEESDLQGLNTSSDAICQLFDTLGFSNQFKVFDIGTYTLQESTNENFGGFLEIARQKIGQTSAYYVIFCRIGDKNDVFRELTLDIKLPTVGRFQCLSNSKRSNLAKIYSSTVNEYLSTLGDRNRNFGKAQIWALDSIYKELKSIVDCCVPTVRSQSCSKCLSDSERKHTLESLGFISIPIDSTFEPLVVGLVNEGERSNRLTITKYSNRKIFIGSEEVQIAQNITSFISNIENLEEDVSVWITSNKNLCAENEFEIAKTESEISESKIKAHFHIDEDSKLLYIRDMSEIILDYSACKPDTTPIEKRFPVFFANWPNVIKVPKYKASYLALNYGFEQSYISRALKFANQIGAFENQMYFFEETKPSHTNRALGPFAVVATTCDNPTTAVVDVQLWKHIFTNPPKSLVGKDYLWLECDNQFDLENNIIPTFEDLGKVSYFYVENLELPWYFPSPNTVKTVAKVVPKISSGSRVLKFQKVLKGVEEIAVDVANATEKQLDDIFAGLHSTPPYKYVPNTMKHKAARWAQYKIEKGPAAKDYSTWSNIYNANMTKANKAYQSADEVMASIGWGQREVTVQAGTYTRRMDIADKVAKKGVEVKSYETGKVYATEDIKGELFADKYLIDNDFWQIEWVFKGCLPSQPLRSLLEQAGITIKLVP